MNSLFRDPRRQRLHLHLHWLNITGLLVDRILALYFVSLCNFICVWYILFVSFLLVRLFELFTGDLGYFSSAALFHCPDPIILCNMQLVNSPVAAAIRPSPQHLLVEVSVIYEFRCSCISASLGCNICIEGEMLEQMHRTVLALTDALYQLKNVCYCYVFTWKVG